MCLTILTLEILKLPEQSYSKNVIAGVFATSFIRFATPLAFLTIHRYVNTLTDNPNRVISQ